MLDPPDGGILWSRMFDEVGPFPMACYGKKPHVLLGEPVLIGGVLALAGLDGLLRLVDPANGELVEVVDTGLTVAAPPVVHDTSVIVVGLDGTMRAFEVMGA